MSKFATITAADWRTAIARARSTPNQLSQQIKARCPVSSTFSAPIVPAHTSSAQPSRTTRAVASGAVKQATPTSSTSLASAGSRPARLQSNAGCNCGSPTFKTAAGQAAASGTDSRQSTSTKY